MNKLDITQLSYIALIAAMIALLLLSIGIVIYSVIVIKKYNVKLFEKKNKTPESIPSISRVNEDYKTISFDRATVRVLPMACVLMSLAIFVMVNDGPNPCELNQNILLDSSYDKHCKNPNIDLF